MTPTERKLRIKSLKEELHLLYQECTHEETETYGFSESKRCKACDKDLGWGCKESPDGVCHYYTADKKVKLAGGILVDPPKDHDFECETDDSCIYCGEPEERK